MPRKTFTFDGRRYSVQAATPEELAVRVAMKKRDLEEGKKRISKTMTVKAWAKTWKKSYIESSVGDITSGDYQTRINKICAEIGDMQLKDVKPLHCQGVLNGMMGSSLDYLQKVRRTMWQMFDMAEQNGLVLSNPANRLRLPEAEDGEGRALTEEEKALVLKVAAYHKAGPWVLLMLYCGLRPGETARVKGCHFDFEKLTLYVDGTKTKKAKRTVPLPPELVPLFRNKSPFDYVFEKEGGGQLTKASRHRLWDSFKREMNIAAGCKVYRNKVLPPYAVADDLVPYCLRHTFGTECVQAAGVPLQMVMEWMGHTNIKTTMRYVHKNEEAFMAGAELLRNYRAQQKEGTVQGGVQPKPKVIGISTNRKALSRR